MKKLYIPMLGCLMFTASCSKDFLKPYDDRIEGVWQLEEVNRRGIGGSLNNLPFRSGQFEFIEGGQLHYTDAAGAVYSGSWNIMRRSNEDGGKSLQITVVDFNSQVVLTEYFDEMLFTGTNRFKAFIYSGAQTYVFHFRR